MISRLSSVGSSADTNMERFNTDASGAGTLELSRLRSVWVALAMASASIHASFWSLQTGASLDDVHTENFSSSATWYSEGTPFGYPLVKLSYNQLASGSQVGIPGGARQDLAGLGTWIYGMDRTVLTGSAGLDALADPTSWRACAQVDWKPDILWGMRTTAKGSSGWMDGWLDRKVRATAAEGSLGWDGPLTWAEIGGRMEDRSGGDAPNTPIPVETAYNRVESLWAWGTRSWTGWLQAGGSMHWADSHADPHQPTEIVNDTLAWADVPAGSPHDEYAVAALCRLSTGPTWISTAWPLWSTSRLRADEPYTASPAYWYRLQDASMAEVDAGWNFVVAKRYVCALAAKALSLPYASRSWFTHDAWNQYGLSLAVRFSAP